jgi:hypothetical protein
VDWQQFAKKASGRDWKTAQKFTGFGPFGALMSVLMPLLASLMLAFCGNGCFLPVWCASVPCHGVTVSGVWPGLAGLLFISGGFAYHMARSCSGGVGDNRAPFRPRLCRIDATAAALLRPGR